MLVIYFEYGFFPSSMMDTPRALLSRVMVNLSLLNLTTMAIPWKRFLLIKERSVYMSMTKWLVLTSALTGHPLAKWFFHTEEKIRF